MRDRGLFTLMRLSDTAAGVPLIAHAAMCYNSLAACPCALSISTAFRSNETNVSHAVRRYKSSGSKPVCFATLASIFGPISSFSWKPNM